jgi:nitrate/TMAO reductase-like tetraheme cytochrome c subunit
MLKENMMQERTSFIGVALALVVVLGGTSSVFAQVQVTDCMACHNDTTVITGKQAGLSGAVHGTGDAFLRGTRSSCAGCHSGGAFSEMVAAGLAPNQVEAGDPNTEADWALETTAAVNLYAFGELMFDGGKGNLCANCHQPRRAIAEPDADGNIAVTSTHWGPHHGPQSAMLLGTGGAGDVAGVPSFHYRLVGDTCVTCHIGADMVHAFEAVEASCDECHAPEDDLDGAMAAVQEKITVLHDLLEAKGLYHDGHPVVGVYPAAEAQALWNYIFIDVEDASSGAHNPPYTNALLDASIAALQ